MSLIDMTIDSLTVPEHGQRFNTGGFEFHVARPVLSEKRITIWPKGGLITADEWVKIARWHMGHGGGCFLALNDGAPVVQWDDDDLFPCPCHSRARLVAARSSQDLACCF